MQGFLAEYGLSSREGVALMCLAEALLRVPDTETIDALIEDKIGASDWAAHLGQSSSPLVNASTWALLLTGKVLGEAEEGLVGALHGAIRRLGEPVIRAAVAQAMRELGHQFVLGRDMGEAKTRAAEQEAQGYSFSYDMLGEAAPHRGGCAPLPPRLFGLHHRARRCRPGREYPRPAGGLGQALGAASALRVSPSARA